MRTIPQYCEDFQKDPDCPPCCTACHDDDRDGWPLGEFELPNGLIVLLCCDVADWVFRKS